MKRALGLLFPIFLLACNPEPKPIRYGQDACYYCRMVISDARFGSEFVTKKGKVYKFDAIECLAAFYLEKRIDPKESHSLWVTDFNRPKTLLKAEEARYLKAEHIQSPMGLGLLAFREEQSALEAKERYGGKILDWQEVLDFVESAWLKQGKHGAHPGE
jgi:copper chaperone NosL